MSSAVVSTEKQQAAREVRLLKDLIADLAGDTMPITTHPSGAVLSDCERQALANRARRLRTDKLAEAERLRHTGEWRDATMASVDAHRARLLIEYHDGLRTSLRGYGLQAWG